MEDEDSYSRHEGRKRRQEEGCGDRKRQRRDSESDSGGGRQTRDTNSDTGDTNDDQQGQTGDRDIVNVSLGDMTSGDIIRKNSIEVRPFHLFSGKSIK